MHHVPWHIISPLQSSVLRLVTYQHTNYLSILQQFRHSIVEQSGCSSISIYQCVQIIFTKGSLTSNWIIWVSCHAHRDLWLFSKMAFALPTAAVQSCGKISQVNYSLEFSTRRTVPKVKNSFLSSYHTQAGRCCPEVCL